VTIRAAVTYLPLMIRVFAAGLALAVAFALAGGASGGGTGWPQPDARDRALLASVLHGMTTDLRTVRLTQLDAMWRKGRAQGTLELVTTASVSRNAHVASIRADWDTLLIAHAYNERCVRGADHCVSVDRGPNGGGGAGRSGAKRPLWSADHLAHAIRRQFAAAGLRVTSIGFEHPYAFAPIITVRTAHPRRASTARVKAEVALGTAFRHSEGSFVEILGPGGRLLFVGAGSGNTGMGWCAPVLKCPSLAPEP
jgi:hypothetical protein